MGRFHRIPDYVTNSGVVVYWGDRSFWSFKIFEDHQAGDGIKEISTFLDNTVLIAIATAEQFRDWIGSNSFWNSEESFRNHFSTKISEKDKKRRGGRSEVFCKVDVLKNFIKLFRKHMCRSLFLNKIPRKSLCNVVKKRALYQCFLWILNNL